MVQSPEIVMDRKSTMSAAIYSTLNLQQGQTLISEPKGHFAAFAPCATEVGIGTMEKLILHYSILPDGDRYQIR